ALRYTVGNDGRSVTVATIKIKRGATFRFTVKAQSRAGKEYDLTGYTGRCQVFPDQDGGAALFTLTSGSSGFDIPTPSNGICNLTFSAAQTANFVVGNSYYFDVRLSNGTDVIYMDPIKISVQWTGTSA
ncbi:MAG TPA: hypothetical protein PLF85_15215, partial [Turneriella sp.]|nr:hypothetical protein [Turneriella sp.]